MVIYFTIFIINTMEIDDWKISLGMMIVVSVFHVKRNRGVILT